MEPLAGAKDFLDALRETYQVIILSDTFSEFAKPLMRQLGLPTLFCHSLEADAEGILVNYHLRMADHKREAVKRLKELNFKVVARAIPTTTPRCSARPTAASCSIRRERGARVSAVSGGSRLRRAAHGDRPRFRAAVR